MILLTLLAALNDPVLTARQTLPAADELVDAYANCAAIVGPKPESWPSKLGDQDYLVAMGWKKLAEDKPNPDSDRFSKKDRPIIISVPTALGRVYDWNGCSSRAPAVETSVLVESINRIATVSGALDIERRPGEYSLTTPTQSIDVLMWGNPDKTVSVKITVNLKKK